MGITNKWHVIDCRLAEWERKPEELEDDGIDPPTRETIQRAIHLAQKLKEAGWPSPDTVVPDANGGIVFERRDRGVFHSLRVEDDGTVEYCRFQDARLVERRPVDANAPELPPPLEE